MENKTILETKGNLKNGQQFCPNCGANETYFEPSVGKLFCPYCETIFDEKKLEQTETNTLEGNVIGTGARKIEKDFNDIVAVRCNGCGAEVLINTKETTIKRCHWCRGILSINERIPNGTIPDAILPFKITKEEAKEEIDKFVKSKSFFALPKFKEEYKIDNIMGVYLPYMLIDANISGDFEGIGEKTATHMDRVKIERARIATATETEVNAYIVKRKFDMTIEDLAIETSSDKIDKTDELKTNNIINSIMPFDTENCVRFQSNYLTGFTSENRDISIEELNKKALAQIKDVARHTLNKKLNYYDRGIKWDKEDIDIKGIRWISAYLPVWIYSYYDKKNKQQHYIAVNGRTKELMGSIPVNKSGLFAISAFLEAFALLISLNILIATNNLQTLIIALFLCLIGPIYYKVTYESYRNNDARHKYEKETKTTIKITEITDRFTRARKNLPDYKIIGQNNTRVDGENIKIEDDSNKEEQK